MSIWFLHEDAKTSASWLKDSDVNKACLESLSILSTVTQLARVERCAVLPDIRNCDAFYVGWALSSAYNYQWLFSYYDTLLEINIRLFKHSHIVYKIKGKLYETLEILPLNKFTAPKDCEQEREAYAKTVKSLSYRKVRMPFWIKSRKIEQEIVAVDPEDDPFLLDLPLDS